MRGREHRLFQLRQWSPFVLRSPNPAGVHSFGRRLEHARRHRAVALAGKNQPREHPRNSAARRYFVKTIEHTLDVGFLRARPPLEKLRLKLSDTAHDHRFDKTFAAAEVMKNRGMRDAGVGGDLLQSNRLGSPVEEPALRSFQDRKPSLRGASTPPNGGPVPHWNGRGTAPGANVRLLRSGSHRF